MDEAISFILQSIVGPQWHWQETVGLFVAHKHLNIYWEQRAQNSYNYWINGEKNATNSVRQRWSTCHLSRVSKHNDVIKSPAVFWVWGVKGQLPGGFFPQVYEEGGVDHWNCKTAPPHLLPDGYVGRGTLIVTLTTQSQLTSSGLNLNHRYSWEMKSLPNLWGHPTPKVWVGCTRLQHGRDDGLVFFHEHPEHIRIGEEIITICQLHAGCTS